VKTIVVLMLFWPIFVLVRRFIVHSRTLVGTRAVFLPVPDLAALDALFAASEAHPVALYLHDPYCPISRGAFRRLDRGGGELHIVDVSAQHELNRAIAERTRIRHESPQVLVLCKGDVLLDASHGEIDPAAVAAAMTAAR
jgi:bacillithiol system protein YtxJ